MENGIDDIATRIFNCIRATRQNECERESENVKEKGERKKSSSLYYFHVYTCMFSYTMNMRLLLK